MKTLTKAEEEIMQVLWCLEKAFVKEVISQLPKPKPAYNTVSTIIRILEEKGFVGHKSFGKSHQYHPIISLDKYQKFSVNNLLGKYFNNSFGNLVSFFQNNEQLSEQDYKELEAILKNKRNDS